MLLTGTFARSVDEKLRVAIPKRLREALGCPSEGLLYVAPGTDGSLAIYAEGGIERLAERLAQASPTQQEVRDFTRLFYARTQRVPLDRQGRIRIPPDLASLAQVGKDVVLLGVQDHVELWASRRWEAYLAERQKRYDQIAEAAFGGTR
jgi:MraZ protein